MKNKKVGAKVVVREVLLRINKKEGWVSKNLSGVIVENIGYEFYYHTCNGDNSNIHKHLIVNPALSTVAVKLDNNTVDIEGNNIIVVYEHQVTFLETITKPKTKVTGKQYLKALETIKKYKEQIKKHYGNGGN